LNFHFKILNTSDPAFCTPFDKIIALIEKDNTPHVETEFADGTFFSADPENGVRFLDTLPHALDPAFWDVVEVPENETDAVVQWAHSILGKPYDYAGAFNSAMGIPVRDPYRWFCSLCAATAATMAGVPGIDPLPDPSKLRQELVGHNLRVKPKAITPVWPIGLAFTDADSTTIQQLVVARKIDVALAQKVINAINGVQT
jgi:hypothetical protein